MRSALPLLIAATALLAGCNAQPAAEPSVAEQEAAMRNAAADLQSWDRVFGFPSETVAKLNQYGYRLTGYQAAKTGFDAPGEAITLSQSDAKAPNRGTVSVTGATADAIDRIVFALPITDDANAETAKKRLTDIIRAFLFQYKIEDDGALDAIAAEQDADGMIGDTPVAIAVDKGEGPRRITVTFSRPSATAPAAASDGNTQQP
ncbi:MAG: hypothetical protein CVT77_06910 [Alphaproteobacteria bacterium HGW-Alphaproteobacteria-16]|nr:MAG: hypothetical protein CVT77_06910 [Alphaproteobacteria bacterium HGW-Alphaproteobacteria-16]